MFRRFVSLSFLTYLLVPLVLTGCGTSGSLDNASSSPTTVTPTITQQPASLTVPIGLEGIFTVKISGNGMLAEQWYRNGVAIPGATALTYTTPTVAATDTGAVFTFTVSNSLGSATSQPATLTAGARAPKDGDLRFQQVDSLNTINGYVGNIGTEIFDGVSFAFPNGIGTPLYIQSGNCGASPSPIGDSCVWELASYFQPSGVTPVTTGYLPDNYSNLQSDLSAGLRGSGSLLTPNTVITSLSLAPVDFSFALSYVQTSQIGGFDLAQHTIDASQFQAAATQEGQTSRVITALGLESGQLVYFSYGWQGDTTTVYETQVAIATFTNAGTVASSLAAQGYIITAIGDDPTNGASGVVMVGTRVQGDTQPRQILVGPLASTEGQITQEGYAIVGVVQYFSGTTLNGVIIGER
jgi:hypothetical protein